MGKRGELGRDLLRGRTTPKAQVGGTTVQESRFLDPGPGQQERRSRLGLDRLQAQAEGPARGPSQTARH